MNIKVFNVCMLVGWLMVLGGGIVINPGWGIAIAGGLLILLVMVAAYIGGIYAPKAASQPGTESA